MDNISNISASTNNPVPPVGQRARSGQTDQVASTPRDTIQVSPAARELQRAEDAARSSSDLRFDVVSRLRSAVNNGTYRVDAQAVAHAMVAKGEQAE